MAKQPTRQRQSGNRPAGHKTRDALLQAGFVLFAHRAIEGVTIDEIVDAADVAKGSFYNHFNDREAFAHAVLEMVAASCDAIISAANAEIDDPAQQLVRVLAVLLVRAASEPEHMQSLLLLSERRPGDGSPLHTRLTAKLTTGIGTGRFSGVDLETAFLLVTGVIRSALRHVMMSAAPVDIRDLGSRIGAALLRALGIDPAEAVMLADRACTSLIPDPTPSA